MMYIKKLILFFLNPLGIILVTTAIAMLSCLSKKMQPRLKRIIVWTCLVVIYLSSTGFISMPLLYMLEHKKSFSQNDCQNYTAVAVLSAGIETGDHSDVNSKINESSLKRIIKGVELAAANKKPLIVLGGGVTKKTEPAEAELLGITASNLGIEKNRLIIEKQSENSHQNILELKDIIQQKKLKKVLVVTSASHGLRVEKLLSKQGIDSCMVLTDYLSRRQTEFSDFVPSIKNMQITAVLIYEILAIIKYSVIKAI